jgi:MFS family permease
MGYSNIMIDISKKSSLKYLLFSSLYFSEGIIYGLAIYILPKALLDLGMDVGVATFLVGISWSPWLVKFFWGGIIDYFQKFGRKRFIILGGAVGSVSYLALTFINPLTFTIPFVIILTIGHLGVVFLDVSADAWAIEISIPEERGKINAAMFSGMFIGAAVAASLFGYVALNISFYLMFPLTALIIFLVILYPLFVEARVVEKVKQKVSKVLIKEFKDKTVQLVSIFSPLSAISFGLLNVVVPLFLAIEFGKDIMEVGFFSTASLIGTIVGAIIGGILADCWGRKKSLYLFYSSNILIAIGFIFAGTWEMVVLLFILLGVVHGGAYSAYGALLMDFTKPKVAGTQYSVYTSLGNAGEMFGNSVSGTLISSIGFIRLFLYSAWLYGPALILLYLIRYKTRFNK